MQQPKNRQKRDCPGQTQLDQHKLIANNQHPPSERRGQSDSSYEEEEREEGSMMFEYMLRSQQLLFEELMKLEVR